MGVGTGLLNRKKKNHEVENVGRLWNMKCILLYSMKH